MSEPLLQVKDLRIDFLIGEEKVNAVNGISFSLEKGRTLGIVGESGCGKSVTAQSILRLLPEHTSEIEAGSSILFEGNDLVTLDQKGLRHVRGNRISMIFQEPMTSLNPVHTIGAQLIEMICAHKKLSHRQAFERGVEMLDKVGIPDPAQRMKEYPHQLSGGMRQRVMIAMALSCDPALLIADEPTTALDVTIQAQILSLMEKLKTELGTSIILITHDMGVVAEIADDVAVMYAGEIVEHAPVKEVFLNPLHPYTVGLLESIPRLTDDSTRRLSTIEGTVPGLTEMPSGCRFAARCPDCMPRCRRLSPEVKNIGGHEVKCWKYCLEHQGGEG